MTYPPSEPPTAEFTSLSISEAHVRVALLRRDDIVSNEISGEGVSLMVTYTRSIGLHMLRNLPNLSIEVELVKYSTMLNSGGTWPYRAGPRRWGPTPSRNPKSWPSINAGPRKGKGPNSPQLASSHCRLCRSILDTLSWHCISAATRFSAALQQIFSPIST
jgi:hypothetical protein